MDLIERIDELQVLIEDAKSMPLSSSAIVNRDQILDLLIQLKEEVPDEVRQARWMARDRDELIARAAKEAERMLTEAREQRDRLLSRTEVVHAAERQGERITEDAAERAAKIRAEAQDYVDQKLAAFEILLHKTLATVEKGREQLQGDRKVGAVPQAPEPPTAEPPFDADADLSDQARH
jgi:cell division septum initiation protein DivIVA